MNFLLIIVSANKIEISKNWNQQLIKGKSKPLRLQKKISSKHESEEEENCYHMKNHSLVCCGVTQTFTLCANINK